MDDDEEFKVEWSDEVVKKAAKDPKLAEALRGFGANARQAMAGVESGQYKSFADGMEKLTGHRPKRVEVDDPAYKKLEGDEE